MRGLRFLGLAFIKEALHLIARPLKLPRQDVRVAAQGDRSVGLALGSLVAHQDGDHLGADLGMVEPGRGGVSRILKAESGEAAAPRPSARPLRRCSAGRSWEA